MYVVFNELHVPKETRDNVANRFAASGDKMKKIPGCLDFMFLFPEEDKNYQIVFTKWETKAAYEDWVNSDDFKEAHKKRRESPDKSAASGNQLYTYEAKHHL